MAYGIVMVTAFINVSMPNNGSSVSSCQLWRGMRIKRNGISGNVSHAVASSLIAAACGGVAAWRPSGSNIGSVCGWHVA